MTTDFHELFYFLTLALIPSYDCNAKCDHCYPSCVPQKERPWDISFVKSVIDKAAVVPDTILARNIHFAGGEPFLYYRDLVEGLDYAKKRGFISSIVTNGFWAHNIQATEEKVRTLYNLGLVRVELSVDNFHQAYIPIERIRNILFVLRKFQLDVLIRTATTKTNTAYSAISKIPPHELAGIRLVASPVNYGGRAAEMIPEEEFYYASSIQGCCYRQLNLAVRFDGNVSPCCAGSDTVQSLSMGNINEEPFIDMINRLRYRYHIKQLICAGPADLIKTLKDGGYEKYMRKQYTSICHACTHIFNNNEIVEYLEDFYRKKAVNELAELLS